MRSSDSLNPVDFGYGHPLPLVYPEADARFAAGPRGAGPVTHTHPLAPAPREDASPAPRDAGMGSWREEGLPGAWVVLLARAAANYPAGCAPLSPITTRRTVAFRW